MKVLVSILLCAAPIAQAGPAADVIRLGNLRFAHYGAVSFMKEVCPRHGIQIEEHIFAKGLDIIPGILAGEVDLAASAADAAISARAAGAPIFVVAGFAKGGARIVVRPDLPVHSIADLKGKRVGVARGGAQELLLLAELSKAKLTWSDKGDKDVQLLYLAYADLNQALLAKNLDAICQSEPQSSQAISKGYGRELIKPYDTPIGEPVRALVMTEKLYTEKPEVAARVLACFVESTRFFLSHPDEAERYVRETLFKGQLSKEDYKDAIGNSPFTYDISVEHVQTTADSMIKYGVGKLPEALSARGFVKLDLLEKAKKEQGVH